MFLYGGDKKMIYGIGTDIIEISRVSKAVRRTETFLEKLFTEGERKYFKEKNFRDEVIAGNFAAKEAISKALGTGFREFGLKDIEVLRDELGKPIVFLSDKICGLLGFEDFKIHVSISHSKENAIAYALLEVEDYD